MTPLEVEAAIQNAFEGVLDEGDCIELREILKADPDARALYFQHASLHQALNYRLARGHAFESARGLSETRLRQQNRRNARLAFAAAAVFILGLGLSLHLLLAREQSALATMRSDGGSRFVVEQSTTGRKKPAENQLHEGALVSLSQGSIELTLRNGVRTIILAPASFQIESEKRMKVHEGTAWFDVGKNGKGFQVLSPGMTVTDLGTQFGVLARIDGDDEVHVFSGRVNARGQAALQTEESLTTGMARLSDPVGRLKTVRLRPEAFLTRLPVHSDSGLIVNGDFETGNPPPARTYGSPATASLLPGWIFSNDITVVHATSEGRPGYGEKEITILSSTGDVQVGFNADTDGRPNPETVSLRQTFSTHHGQTYAVRFELGAIIFDPSTMEVTATVHDGALETPAAKSILASHIERRTPEAGNGYNPPASFTFTAASGTTTLVFTETSARSKSADPVIDNISVNPVD